MIKTARFYLGWVFFKVCSLSPCFKWPHWIKKKKKENQMLDILKTADNICEKGLLMKHFVDSGTNDSSQPSCWGQNDSQPEKKQRHVWVWVQSCCFLCSLSHEMNICALEISWVKMKQSAGPLMCQFILQMRNLNVKGLKNCINTPNSFLLFVLHSLSSSPPACPHTSLQCVLWPEVHSSNPSKLKLTFS